MLEREAQKERAVQLRMTGRSGPKIAARIGITTRTLYLWLSQDDDFAVRYYRAWKNWKSRKTYSLIAMRKEQKHLEELCKEENIPMTENEAHEA